MLLRLACAVHLPERLLDPGDESRALRRAVGAGSDVPAVAVPPSLIGSSASPHRLPGHRQARHELNQVGPGDVPHRAMRVSSAGATRLPSPHRLNFAETFVLTGYGRGRSSSRVRHRSGLLAGSTGGKRRPDPHGQRSLRPSFSTSSVSMPTTRSPRLTLDSLEGTPGGVCRSAQKDAPASRSRSMAVLLVWRATGS